MTARRINLNLNKMNYIYIHITLAEMGEERATGTEYQSQNAWQCNELIANFFFTFYLVLFKNCGCVKEVCVWSEVKAKLLHIVCDGPTPAMFSLLLCLK